MKNKKLALEQLQTEIDAGFLYKTIAELEKDSAIAIVFHQLSEIETQHVSKWQAKHLGAGTMLPPPSARARVLAWIARRMGYEYILPILINTERGIAQSIASHQGSTSARGLWNHVAILKELDSGAQKVSGSELARLEGKHKSVGGNALRAAVLGANDGLVSNLSLVMGVAGADSDGSAILIAGFAGLLAGSISMALGEWLSVQSSRELYQRQLDIEMEELENAPEEELRELALIYQARGLGAEEARAMASQVMSDKTNAQHTLIREELGFDPEELGGSAWTAAFTSFVLFAVGAIIPVIPFLFGAGSQAVLLSLAGSTIGLFGIGAAITLFTGRKVIFSGIRQVLFGLAAAAVTFGIGKLIGVAVVG